jgi:hypothetical protein
MTRRAFGREAGGLKRRTSLIEHSDMSLDLRGVRLKLAHPDSAPERQSSCLALPEEPAHCCQDREWITIDPKMTNAVA